jgi:GT2 family glycosyltransferase
VSRLRAPDGAVVCVPARDEAERLPILLACLAAQTGFGPDARLGVVVVANNCTDGTAEAVRRAVGGAGPLALRLIQVELGLAEAHVGTARRMALDAGADWLAQEGMPNGVLLSTDADARVAPHWVEANLAALAEAEIVGGALVIDPDGEAEPEVRRLHEAIAAYWAAVREIEERLDPPAHDPAPRHGDHTGASLALRADLYRDVGGLPPLPGGEDNALVARVVDAGGRLRHDPRVEVLVSDRTAGRAAGGMAMDMARRRAVARGELPYLLPHPDHWRQAIERRAALRRAWRQGPAAAERALRGFGLGVAEAAQVDVARCPGDVAFVERASRLMAAPDPSLPDLPVEEALALFRCERASRRGAA